MVGIHPADRKYFTFDLNGRLFQAAALPFGFNQSPHYFTQLVSVWTKWMRSANSADITKRVERARTARPFAKGTKPAPDSFARARDTTGGRVQRPRPQNDMVHR